MTVAELEAENIELDSMQEFVREPYTSIRDSYATAQSQPAQAKKSISLPFASAFNPTATNSAVMNPPVSGTSQQSLSEELATLLNPPTPTPKSEELETLWPGTHASNHYDFIHVPQSKRSSVLFLSVGFVAGVITTVMCSSLFTIFSGGNNADAVSNLDPDKKIVLAEGAGKASSQGKVKSKDASTTVVTKANLTNTQEVIVPVTSTYEVKEGDTLAGIALHAYKRVSPRLLDTICKANNMRNANVLTLGQKIVLPEYRPIYIQTGSDSNVNH